MMQRSLQMMYLLWHSSLTQVPHISCHGESLLRLVYFALIILDDTVIKNKIFDSAKLRAVADNKLNVA